MPLFRLGRSVKIIFASTDVTLLTQQYLFPSRFLAGEILILFIPTVSLNLSRDMR